MKEKTILLIDIDPLTSRKGFENIGLGYIASVLRDNGFNVILKKIWSKYCNKESLKIFAEQFDNIDIAVVGISLFNTNILYADIFLRFLVEKHENMLKVCGGTYATICGEELLKQFPIFDVIVTGEGEITFLELCNAFYDKGFTIDQLSSVDGIIYRNMNQIKRNCPRKPIEDINYLPPMARDILLEQPYEEPNDIPYTSICTSRGCYGNCSFCCANTISKHDGVVMWRGRTVESVVDEIESVSKKYNLFSFCIMDSSIEDPNKERLDSLCNEIMKRKLNLFFRIETRASSYKSTDTKLLKKLYHCGMRFAIVGIESGSKKMLELYRKKATVNDNKTCLELFKKNGIFVQPGFIMFNPYTDYSDLEESAKFLYDSSEAYRWEWLSSRLSVYYNSEMWHYLKEDNLIIDPDNIVDDHNYYFKNEKMKDICSAINIYRTNEFDIEFKRSDYLECAASIFCDSSEREQLGLHLINLNRIRQLRGEHNFKLFMFITDSIRKGLPNESKFIMDKSMLDSLKRINSELLELTNRARANKKTCAW